MLGQLRFYFNGSKNTKNHFIWNFQEEAERVLAKRERQLNIQGSKVHYKKKLRPVVVTKPHERFQLQQGGGGGRSGLGSSTPEVLSTSPESPYRLTQQGQEMGDSCLPVVVRENPLFYQRLVELHQFQLDMGVTQLLTQKEKRTTTTQGQRVRALGMTRCTFCFTLYSDNNFSFLFSFY
jgi:hypothetical protein